MLLKEEFDISHKSVDHYSLSGIASGISFIKRIAKGREGIKGIVIFIKRVDKICSSSMWSLWGCSSCNWGWYISKGIGQTDGHNHQTDGHNHHCLEGTVFVLNRER